MIQKPKGSIYEYLTNDMEVIITCRDKSEYRGVTLNRKHESIMLQVSEPEHTLFLTIKKESIVKVIIISQWYVGNPDIPLTSVKELAPLTPEELYDIINPVINRYDKCNANYTGEIVNEILKLLYPK